MTLVSKKLMTLSVAIPPAKLSIITTCKTQSFAFPVRMNTFVATGPSTAPNVAETIEAEKEVFQCNPSPTNDLPTIIEEVIIFTKTLEDMNTGKSLGTQFVVVTCAKNIATTTYSAYKTTLSPFLSFEPYVSYIMAF